VFQNAVVWLLSQRRKCLKYIFVIAQLCLPMLTIQLPGCPYTSDARQWYFQNSLQLNPDKWESLIVGTSHQPWAASSVDLLLLTRWKHSVSPLISVWISTVSCATTTCRLSTTYVIWSHVDVSLMLVWSCPASTTATLSSTAHHLAPSQLHVGPSVSHLPVHGWVSLVPRLFLLTHRCALPTW